LDVIDSVYPDLILGSGESSLVPKPTGKKKRKAHSLLKDPLRHVNAVTSISWNKTQKNILLSASADHTVKLWVILQKVSYKNLYRI
jgi:periodic tryptophan protein 1